MDQQDKTAPRVDLQRFKAALQKRVPAVVRFRIDARHYAEDVPQMLRLCYQQEVEKRGRIFEADEATEHHIASVARWLVTDRAKPGLFLYGNPGNGKSTMANAMRTLIGMLYANEERWEDRRGVVAVSALQLAEEAKQETGKLSTFRTCPMLQVDDVGTEPASVKVWGNEVSPLTDILYSRYDKMLYTVITSNLYEEDICKRYGERIADRFREMFDLLSFDNPSYR